MSEQHRLSVNNGMLKRLIHTGKKMEGLQLPTIKLLTI